VLALRALDPAIAALTFSKALGLSALRAAAHTPCLPVSFVGNVLGMPGQIG
jgi:hypothetical protein